MVETSNMIVGVEGVGGVLAKFMNLSVVGGCVISDDGEDARLDTVMLKHKLERARQVFS